MGAHPKPAFCLDCHETDPDKFPRRTDGRFYSKSQCLACRRLLDTEMKAKRAADRIEGEEPPELNLRPYGRQRPYGGVRL